MSKKKQKKQQHAPQEEVRKREDLLDTLPRSITPIGIFFGHGAKRDDTAEQPSLFGRRRERRRRNPMGTPLQRNIAALAVAVLFGVIWFIVSMPSLNLRDSHFWTMLMLATAAFMVVKVFLQGTADRDEQHTGGAIRAMYETFGVSAIVAAVVGLVLIVGNLSGWVFIRTNAYAQLVSFSEGVFLDDIAPATEATLPSLDTAAASVLAQEELDANPNLSGTFALSKNGSQIVYRGELVHVIPLDFAGFQENMRGSREGIPAYILVHDGTREVELVMVDGGLRFGSANYLMGDINRHLRITYPTEIFRDTHFELDDDGTPFWVSSVMEKKVGLFGGDDVSGVILTNAITGESNLYALAEIPEWVDAAYSVGLLLTQYNNYGIYHNGFFNAITDKVDVTSIARGYGFAAQGNDLYVCAGVSAVTDVRTTIGYLYINQRTKETVFYPIGSNDEVTVQTAALEAVGAETSISSYPVLVNVNGTPTYCMCIMDEGFSFKDVALVALDDPTLLATGDDVGACMQEYAEKAASPR